MFVVIMCTILTACSHEKTEDVIYHHDGDQRQDCSQMTPEFEDELKDISLRFEDANLLINDLNQEVLTSTDQVEEELEKVNYLNCLQVGVSPYDEEARPAQLLQLYFTMLEYFHAVLKEDEDIQVKNIIFNDDSKHGYFTLKTVLKDQRELNIKYYIGSMAHSRHFEDQLGLDQEESDGIDQFVHAIKTNVIDQLYLFFKNPVQDTLDTVIPSYYEDKNDLDWEDRVGNIGLSSSYFRMEIFIADGELKPRRMLENETRWRKVDVFPTSSTWEPLERWEEMHLINPDIAYPEEFIQNENWLGVAEFFEEHRADFLEIDSDIPEYIYSDSTRGRKLEDVANGIKE